MRSFFASWIWFAAVAALTLAPAPAHADFMITIYSDGLSCPGNCDAHVVFLGKHNGTRAAFDPASSRSQPAKCKSGENCRICFGSADASCMTTRYRGAGPKENRFDFTPAFFEENCGRADIPAQLKSHCATLDRVVKQGKYDKRVNCIGEPTHAQCTSIIAKADAAKSADKIERDKCLQLGEAKYNAQQPDRNKRRSLACNYSQLSLGGGGRWKNLLPAACPDKSYVGRDGLDCCTADRRLAASLHRECEVLFPLPK